MKGKWTPGPWTVDQYNPPITVYGQKIPCFEVASSKDACWIAKVQDHRSCIATPEGNANANLIAAAPDLYAALEEIVALTDRKTDIWNKARAALAKARGEV